jgi:rsbT co-antagonist protein RsbR
LARTLTIPAEVSTYVSAEHKGAMSQTADSLSEVLDGLDRDAILHEWLEELLEGESKTQSGAPAAHAEASDLLTAVTTAIRSGAELGPFELPIWSATREILERISISRAAQGASSADTSQFVLALKKPLFGHALRRLKDLEPSRLVEVMWLVSTLVDKMAQWTTTTYQRSREAIIGRQQEELLELSTPVIKLWEGILAVPMIGTLDSSRTQLVMESLLQRIVDTGSELAIIDITGVPTVDTLVAQHLLKTVAAIRLMGADCIVSGVRPQIAQTIVQLGIDLEGIVTKATLADALSLALKKVGYTFSRSKA